MNDTTDTTPDAETLAKLQADRKALEDFVIDNEDLELLESQLDQFNIFEAVNIVRQELRHSDFLGFLLDPRQPHGLGDTFLKKLLQKALLAVRDDALPLPVSLIDLDVWSLTDSLVLREWSNIDILLVNATHRLVVVIENKVDSGEHSGQLNRYLKVVHHHYPDYKVLPLFLTRQGQLPSDERYIPVSYLLVVNLLETILASRLVPQHDDVTALIRHYVSMVRRHIVNQNEINELARRIYAKHQRAIDLILEQKPDNQVAVIDRLKEHIQKAADFEMDYRSQRIATFTAPAWDALLPPDPKRTEWSPKGRVSRFEFKFENENSLLTLKLWVGLGEKSVRQPLIDVAREHRPPFKVTNHPGELYKCIFSQKFLQPDELSDPTDVLETVDKKWNVFLTETWPTLNALVTTGLAASTQTP